MSDSGEAEAESAAEEELMRNPITLKIEVPAPQIFDGGERQQEAQHPPQFLAFPSISQSEIVAAVHQLLLDAPLTSALTAFRLELCQGSEENDGVQPMDLYAELGTFPAIASAAAAAPAGAQAVIELKMKLEDYSVKKAREHVQRFKELLAAPPVQQKEPSSAASQATAASSDDEKAEAAAADAKREARAQYDAATRLKQCSIPVAANEGLAAFFNLSLGIDEHEVLRPSAEAAKSSHASSPTIDELSPRCGTQVQFGPWNPPPAARRLQGDLLYLEVLDSLLNLQWAPGGSRTPRGQTVTSCERHYMPISRGADRARKPEFSWAYCKRQWQACWRRTIPLMQKRWQCK